MDRVGTWYDWPYRPVAVSSFDMSLNSKEYLEFLSYNHKPVGSGWSGGGPFISKKREREYSPTDAVSIRLADKPYYDGAFVTNPPVVPTFWAPLRQLNTLGPELWNKAKPAKPELDFGNAIYELKDLPGMVKQGFDAVRHLTMKDELLPRRYQGVDTLTLKNVSDFHLATYFGWLPLLSDCVGLYVAQRKMSKTIEQVLRDAGRPVRRKFRSDEYSSKTDNQVDEGSSLYGLHFTPKMLTGAYSGDLDPWTLKRVRSEEVWFAAQFRYFFDDCAGLTASQWKAKLKRRLFGLNPTPAAIYKAMPWSWLIDWFGNIGDNLSNLQSGVADRLIADYAFVMRHVQDYHLFNSSLSVRQGEGVKVLHASSRAGTDFKERTPASPFGFGVKLPDLSPFQTGILASLGGSKGGRFGST